MEPITITHVYHTPIEKVWKALTDLDELKQWYFPLKEFKPEVGFKFQFIGGSEDGPQYLHFCKITAVENGHKIAYSWVYDGLIGQSEVSWELHRQGAETKLVLKHIGVESFAENGKDFTKESFTGGWTYFVKEALLNYLKK